MLLSVLLFQAAVLLSQDPIPKMAKLWFLYARPGEKVLLMPHGDMVVCPTPLDVRLQSFRRSELLHL